MSVTKRIERAIEALEKGQVKRALYTLDHQETADLYPVVEEAAKSALKDRGHSKTYLEEARNKLLATTRVPLDEVGLDGVSEFINSRGSDSGDDYEDCEECHVAVAVSAFNDICSENPQESCTMICDDRPDISPAEWVRRMAQVEAEASRSAKQPFSEVLGELVDYLGRRNSPILDELKNIAQQENEQEE